MKNIVFRRLFILPRRLLGIFSFLLALCGGVQAHSAGFFSMSAAYPSPPTITNVTAGNAYPGYPITVMASISGFMKRKICCGDIGNANCDGKVNLQDLMTIKNAYNTVKGDACYRAWADFNMDGKVGLADLAFMKYFYNKTIAPGPVADAALCLQKDPLPACCASKTCP